ncbi:MAG TPA: adenylate/guanylate cyclase domain-containing protein, partial [Anaerolineales bacterium]
WMDWFSTNAFSVDKQRRRFFRLLPHDPRCKFCNAPFEGIGGKLVKLLYRKERSNLNPRFCNMCDLASRTYPGGNEVEMSILFADVRGSTALSGTMTPREFSRLINRFYLGTTSIISQADGLVEKLAGDSVSAFWGAGFAGPDYVQRTIQVAREMSQAMQKAEIPVGIAVHAGVAFFGVVGSEEGLMDISAIGDEVNTAARLCAQAGAGEVLVSEQALRQAGMDGEALEKRTLELKGVSRPVSVRVLAGA